MIVANAAKNPPNNCSTVCGSGWRQMAYASGTTPRGKKGSFENSNTAASAPARSGLCAVAAYTIDITSVIPINSVYPGM